MAALSSHVLQPALHDERICWRLRRLESIKISPAAVARFTASCSRVSLDHRPLVASAARGAERAAGGASPARKAPVAPTDGKEIKEAHKIFDDAFITVKSGRGGLGEIVEEGKGKYVKNLKYKPGGSSAKKIWLPASEPADGADGADVVLVCDPEYDNLLHLHTRKEWAARDGSNANPAVGSGGPKKNKDIKKAFTPPLEIPVPPGTVVKRKSSGVLLGELINPGDRLVVAKGGKGGLGVVAPSRASKLRDLRLQWKVAKETGAEVVTVEDNNWHIDTRGSPGEQLSVQLLLRVVADVGIVGFPNAGKSSLLRQLTHASPEVAPYPFTTLMPNLGVLHLGSAGPAPVLADLPGLIEGAHKGKGLGRMFLRHLRRTSMLLHVVDASAADPATDYYAVREEVRMYNPEYCTRPHIIALNKMDLEDASALREAVVSDILAAAERHCEEWKNEELVPRLPLAVIACSAVSGEGLSELQWAVQQALNRRGRPFKAINAPRHSTFKVPVLGVGFTTAAAAAAAAATGAADAESAISDEADSSSSSITGLGAPGGLSAAVAHTSADEAAPSGAYTSASRGLQHDSMSLSDAASSTITKPPPPHAYGVSVHAETVSSSRQCMDGDDDGDDTNNHHHDDDEDHMGNDDLGNDELDQMDPDDAWLFELTENQLLALLDRDDRMYAVRAAAALATAGADSSDAAASSSTSSSVQSAGDNGEEAAEMEDEFEEGEDGEWAYNGEEEQDAGEGERSQMGDADLSLDPEDAHLLQLSEEELLAMIDDA